MKLHGFHVTFNHRTPDIATVEARKSSHVDVRGEFLSPFLIDTYEISLQAHFSDVADTSMYIPYKWSAKIYSSYELQKCSANH